MDARFDQSGVELRLSPAEYAHLHSVLAHVLYGHPLKDHDFRNILGMSKEDSEAMFEALRHLEAQARSRGEHWLRSHAQP